MGILHRVLHRMYVMGNPAEGLRLYLPCTGICPARMRYYKKKSGIEAVSLRENFPDLHYAYAPARLPDTFPKVV
jgi:hypothetical protein